MDIILPDGSVGAWWVLERGGDLYSRLTYTASPDVYEGAQSDKTVVEAATSRLSTYLTSVLGDCFASHAIHRCVMALWMFYAAPPAGLPRGISWSPVPVSLSLWRLDAAIQRVCDGRVTYTRNGVTPTPSSESRAALDGCVARVIEAAREEGHTVVCPKSGL